MYKKYIKRLIDVVLAVSFLLAFWWLYFIVGVLVKLNLGSPILFKQQRPGINGEIFTIYKFRSMAPPKNLAIEWELIRQGKKKRSDFDGKRINKFGNFLRNSSLDEIPELWNVIRGDMSLVGPRPLIVDYLPLYSPEQARRHDIRPGITGWAQVNGRELICWEEKFKLDVEYVDSYSFFGDMKILLLTIKNIIFREGVSPEGEVTTDDFRGSN